MSWWQRAFVFTSLLVFLAACTNPTQNTPSKPSSGNSKPSTPTSSTPAPGIKIETGKTDPNGRVTFPDYSTSGSVTLNVIDYQNQSPIPYMRTTSWQGDGFRVFLVEDTLGNYLPSLGLYPHNSEHTIETGKIGDGFYDIATVSENSSSLGKVVWSWQSENKMNFSTYNYYETINYDEYLKIKDRNDEVLDFAWKGIEKFTGISLPKKPSEIINHFFPESKNPPKRWDVYTYNDGYGQSAILTMIPSNIPSVTIQDPEVNGSQIDIRWHGADKDTYDGFTFLPDNRDLTRYLDGNSTSDLNYSYEITKDGEVYKDHSWSTYGSGTSATINISDPGNYSVGVRARDEVDNIGESSRDFSVSGPPSPPPVKHTVDIQPGPEQGKDAYITRYHFTWPKDRYVYSETDSDILNIENDAPGVFAEAYLTFPSDSIPAGAKVDSARLRVYGYSPENVNVLIKKITSSWEEFTGSVSSLVPTSSEIYASFQMEKGKRRWYETDVTSLVNTVAPGDDYSLTLTPGGTEYSNHPFNSSDYLVDPTLRPTLEITYETTP